MKFKLNTSIHNIRIKVNFVKHLRIKISEKSLTQRFDVAMTSLSSDKERKKDKKPDYSPKNSQEYKIYTNNEDTADQFNININVGPNLTSTIDKSNENPTQYISSSSINSFVMENVTEAHRFLTCSKNLDTNKSSIGIPNKLIIMAAVPLSAPFT